MGQRLFCLNEAGWRIIAKIIAVMSN